MIYFQLLDYNLSDPVVCTIDAAEIVDIVHRRDSIYVVTIRGNCIECNAIAQVGVSSLCEESK